MKTIGIIQFVRLGYPQFTDAVKYKLNEGENTEWKTISLTYGQKSYLQRLSYSKKVNYILNHFENN